MKSRNTFWRFTQIVGFAVSALGLTSIAHAGSVSVSVSPSSIMENGGSVRVTFHNNEDAQLTYRYWTTNGTATGGSDFQTWNGNITLPYLGSKTLYMPIINDNIQEFAETFSICAGFAAGSEEGCATVTIIDEDLPAAAVSFAIADASAVESDGSITFAVTRSGSSSGDYTVNYSTANGTATSTSDYVAKSGTLTFASNGPTTQYITVSLRNNLMVEAMEYFYVNLSAASGGASISDNQGRGNVYDDDEPIDECGTNGQICP